LRFSSEPLTPREPIHIHARGNGNDAKFWLHPEVRSAYCDGFNRQEQLDMIRAVEAHRDEIERVWNERFS
jgi:hypothetical protein